MVISADGASALSRSVASNVAQGLQLSGDLTGLDVAALTRRLSGASGAAGCTAASRSGDGGPNGARDGQAPSGR